MAGKKIGNFEIVKEIGRGGMGVVYEAVEPALGRTVALKVLPANLAANDAFIARFSREARAVAQLTHPNVVTIYSIGEDGGERFLAMEFVRGQDLSDIIRKRGRLDIREALEITRQCAEALAAAHTRGIIHRDIKPHNIMLDESGRPKIMDFGIAKMSEEMNSALTRTGDILGTPAYMSPEQCRGRQLDGRSDLYSLGVVFYQMLSGHLPFRGDTPVTVIQKILFEDAPSLLDFNPDVPPAVVFMVQRCMSKEPDERYASCRDLARDLGRFLSGDHSIPDPGVDESEAPTNIGPSRLARDVREKMPTAPHQAQAFKGRASVTTVPDNGPKAASSLAKGLLFGGVMAIALIGGAIIGVKQLGEKKSAPKRPVEQSVIEPSASTPLAAARVDTPLPKPESPTAQVGFTEAPANGARVMDSPIRVAWEIRNDAVVEGFLVGLNDPNPKVRITDMSKTFELASTGPQTLTIVPLLAGGGRGEAVTRKFTYQPNRAPTLSAQLAAGEITEGDAVRVTATAKDLDGDQTAIEASVDGGEWGTVFNGAKEITSLGRGKHRIQVRASDPNGAASEIWSGEVQVRERTVATVKTVSPPAPNEAPVVVDSLRGTGAENLSQALALTKGARGDFPPDRARELIQGAADLKDPLAEMLLARSYQHGENGFGSDPAKAKALASAALPQVESKAQARDPYAAWLLASAKEEGIGTSKDPIEAVHWYNQAAKFGHPAAMNDLGWMYDTGAGVAVKKSDAVEWYQKGAEAGNVNAMHNLALCNDEGDGIKADDTQAAYWYRRAADLGHTGAMFNLAELYRNGEGVSANESEALKWYLKAAEAGDTDAMTSAGWMYETGTGTEVLLETAAKWYRRAADAGHATAICNLAAMMDEGRGVPKDPKKALELYLKSAQYGNPRAMYNVGVSFDKGEGLARDPAQATYWYTKAAEAGHPPAMNMLGGINEAGVGGARDLDRAVSWYQKAARAGNADAQANLNRLGKSW